MSRNSLDKAVNLEALEQADSAAKIPEKLTGIFPKVVHIRSNFVCAFIQRCGRVCVCVFFFGGLQAADAKMEAAREREAQLEKR